MTWWQRVTLTLLRIRADTRQGLGLGIGLRVGQDALGSDDFEEPILGRADCALPPRLQRGWPPRIMYADDLLRPDHTNISSGPAATAKGPGGDSKRWDLEVNVVIRPTASFWGAVERHHTFSGAISMGHHIIFWGSRCTADGGGRGGGWWLACDYKAAAATCGERLAEGEQRWSVRVWSQCPFFRQGSCSFDIQVFR